MVLNDKFSKPQSFGVVFDQFNSFLPDQKNGRPIGRIFQNMEGHFRPLGEIFCYRKYCTRKGPTGPWVKKKCVTGCQQSSNSQIEDNEHPFSTMIYKAQNGPSMMINGKFSTLQSVSCISADLRAELSLPCTRAESQLVKYQNSINFNFFVIFSLKWCHKTYGLIFQTFLKTLY